MLISDDDKRQIMRELAQGKINTFWEVPPVHPENDQKFDLRDYSTFDDFAQRPSREQWQYFNRFLRPNSDFTQP